MTSKLLITGANGQVGYELSARARDKNIQAIAVERDALDITNKQTVAETVARVRPAAVINAAAYTAVDKAETEADLAFAVNRDGPAYLAEACRAAGIPLVHISTDYVFDGTKRGAYVETDLTRPLGAYGASKLAGEGAIRETTPQHLIVRTSWVYGVHGHNFVKTMLRLGAERDRLAIVNDQHGCPTSAADLADALLHMTRTVLTAEDPSSLFGTFHAANAGPTTWHDFARRIFDRATKAIENAPAVEPIPTSEYPTPARRPQNSVLDCSKLDQIYGIRLRPWQAALDDMLTQDGRR